MYNSDKTGKIWCLAGAQSDHLKPVDQWFSGRREFVWDSTCDPEAMLRGDPQLVACVNDYPYEIARCLDVARSAGIPTLVVQDGILEWRCQYHNPLFGEGGGAPQHQPVLADKIACLGQQSARQIAAWGNATKVEVTGSPRFDSLLNRPAIPVQRPGARILVMTAKNPGFTAEQREVTLRSLRDVKNYLQRLEGISILWRTSRSVAQELGVEHRVQQYASAELAACIEQSDAVISTLSTSLLEAMLLGRPAVALDYHNVPRFVLTAWTISAPQHIQAVVNEILRPSPAKMAFQRDCLDDTLCHDGPASARVGMLMERLMELGAEARANQCRPCFPPALLPRTSHTSVLPSLAQLYPESHIFRDSDVRSLQARLARAETRAKELEEQLESRSLTRSLLSMGRQMRSYLRPAN